MMKRILLILDVDETLGRIACEAFRDCLLAEVGQRQRSRNRCSGWLQLQAGVSKSPAGQEKTLVLELLAAGCAPCLRRWG